MKNELDRILKKYFSEDQNAVHYYGDGSRVDKLEVIIRNLVPFEHPDAYAILDDEVLILEHFEFDSSANFKRKGSQQKHSQAEDDRAFAAIIPTEEGTMHHGSITANYTMENYRNNLRKVFCKHYNEIDAYKQTIRENGIATCSERITTAFFIEDTTLFGNVFKTEKKAVSLELLVLPLCDFFLDLFENSPDLDVVLSASQSPREHYLWYIDRTMIPAYREYEIITDRVKIFDFNPKSIGYKIAIPEDAIQNYKSIGE